MEFGLRGLFGVDCVMHGGVPYPVEINPRYTASVEVLEHATGLVAMDVHRRAFTDELGDFHPAQRAGRRVIGKAILYARQRLVMPADGPWTASFDQPATGFREFADISHPGELIDQGQPVMSLFAQADTAANCVVELQQRVRSSRPLAVWPVDYMLVNSLVCQGGSAVPLTPTLNERAQRLADYLAANAAQHRIRVHTTANGARLLDCGIDTPGGLQAGLALARICLANSGGGDPRSR